NNMFRCTAADGEYIWFAFQANVMADEWLTYAAKKQGTTVKRKRRLRDSRSACVFRICLLDFPEQDTSERRGSMRSQRRQISAVLCSLRIALVLSLFSRCSPEWY